jgi:hypothetical protein
VRFSRDPQRPLEQPLSLDIALLQIVEQTEIVQRCRDSGMISAELLLLHSQHAPCLANLLEGICCGAEPCCSFTSIAVVFGLGCRRRDCPRDCDKRQSQNGNPEPPTSRGKPGEERQRPV